MPDAYSSSTKIFFGDVTEGEFLQRHDIKDSVNWEHFLLNKTTYPELDREVDRVLGECLGYLPSEAVCLPFLPYLKALINKHGLKDGISDEIVDHVKLIRNRDMKVGFWDRNLKITEACQEYYDTFLPHWRYVAKDQMTHYLGYEPPTRISFMPEILLRKILEKAGNKKHLIRAGCFKAITIYKFRRAILDHSYEAAIHSDLFLLEHV